MIDKHSDEFDCGIEDGKSIKTIGDGNYLVDTTTGETFPINEKLYGETTLTMLNVNDARRLIADLPAALNALYQTLELIRENECDATSANQTLADIHATLDSAARILALEVNKTGVVGAVIQPAQTVFYAEPLQDDDD